MNKLNSKDLYSSYGKNHWDAVLGLLSTVRNRYFPMFGLRGDILHQQWGKAYEQIVHMMYWTDRLSRNQAILPTPLRDTKFINDDKRLIIIANELKDTPERIHKIMLLDPDYESDLKDAL